MVESIANGKRSEKQHYRISGLMMRAAVITIAATTSSFATFPTMAYALGEDRAHANLHAQCEGKAHMQLSQSHHSEGEHNIHLHNSFRHLSSTKRDTRQYDIHSSLDRDEFDDVGLQNVQNLCRGGDIVGVSSANHGTYTHTKLNKEEENSWPETDPSASNAIANAYDQRQSPADYSSQVINTGRIRLRKKRHTAMSEDSIENDDGTPAQIIHERHLQSQPFTPRPRLVIEFDTQAFAGGIDHTNSIRKRIRSRIGTDNEWDTLSHNRGPVLSVSFDALSPPSPSVMQQQEVPQYQHAGNRNINNDQQSTFLNNIITPTATAIILVTQTAALLPSLLISRRVLNFTWTAIVDYIRGRTVRTTFTNLGKSRE